MIIEVLAVGVLLILITAIILYAKAVRDLARDSVYYFRIKDYESLAISVLLLIASITVIAIASCLIVGVIYVLQSNSDSALSLF